MFKIGEFSRMSGLSINTLYHYDELPIVEKMACIVHNGSFATIGKTYETMYKWISENKYSICGPIREIYHKGEWATDNQDEYVTELQFPIN